ncbi:hypothetical protein D3C83_224620 [compost metagenome]
MVWPLWFPEPICGFTLVFGETVVSPVLASMPTLCEKAIWLKDAATKPANA